MLICELAQHSRVSGYFCFVSVPLISYFLINKKKKKKKKEKKKKLKTENRQKLLPLAQNETRVKEHEFQNNVIEVDQIEY